MTRKLASEQPAVMADDEVDRLRVEVRRLSAALEASEAARGDLGIDIGTLRENLHAVNAACDAAHAHIADLEARLAEVNK